MNTVEPIRDTKKIAEIKNYLLHQNHARGRRNCFLFVLGINTGARVSDMLSFKVKNVLDSVLEYSESKTKKTKRFPINEQLRIEIEQYTEGMRAEDFLFPSKKGGRISRIQAYNILSAAGRAVGLEKIGTHTMRKTFGYHHYKRFKDVALLQEIFNHSSQSVTLRYIGIAQDDIDATLKDFYL
ncbi:MAG: site-specific integrase [Defluviitaleaceae bacterium]|nr:site-specific integrase [Defluviitaleaceae bacterium]